MNQKILELESELDNLNNKISKLTMKNSIYMENDGEILQLYKLHNGKNIIIDHINVNTDHNDIISNYGHDVLYKKIRKINENANAKMLYDKELERLTLRKSEIYEEIYFLKTGFSFNLDIIKRTQWWMVKKLKYINFELIPRILNKLMPNKNQNINTIQYHAYGNKNKEIIRYNR